MKVCKLWGCDRKHWSHGYCRLHYERVKKHGTTDRFENKTVPECNVDGCQNVASIVGFCKKHYDQERHKNKPLSAKANHDHHLKYRYGITATEYYEKLKIQAYVCEICFSPEEILKSGQMRRLAVDHDHITGKVRGLLCRNCNVALGSVKDDIQTLQDMIEYLEKYLKD